MSIWELFLTAVALSMDAMAVAVSAGLSNAGGKGVKFREAGLMGLFFGVFQAVMPLLGYYIIPLLAMIFGSGVTRFVEGTDHWIAFVLLVFLGGKNDNRSRSRRRGGRTVKPVRTRHTVCNGNCHQH